MRSGVWAMRKAVKATRSPVRLALDKDARL